MKSIKLERKLETCTRIFEVSIFDCGTFTHKRLSLIECLEDNGFEWEYSLAEYITFDELLDMKIGDHKTFPPNRDSEKGIIVFARMA